jgi:hypothetical protein
MEFTMELLNQFLQAVGRLMLQPLYYLGIVLILMQYRRQITLERKLFHTRLHSIAHESWRMLLWGWVGGLAASIIMAFVGASLTTDSVYLLWAVSLILLLFRVRFLSVAYAAGILGLLQTVLTLFPALKEQLSLQWLTNPIQQLQIVSLLAVVAILHGVEAILIRIQGERLVSPVLLEGKRGKLVGGYQLQSYWPIPLFLLMPTAGGTLDLPWMPWFNGAGDAASSNGNWGFIALPVILGFTELTKGRLPADKIRRSSSLLLLYAFIIFLSAVLSYYWSSFIGIASLLTIFLHEGLTKISQWEEAGRTPLYVHNEQGLKILAVLPNSPAAELELMPGEIIHKVNLTLVRTKQELHQAMGINPAFCRLEVINVEGHSKFVSKAIYNGDHHELGILLSPDMETLEYIPEKQQHMHFLHGLKRKRKERTIYEENSSL